MVASADSYSSLVSRAKAAFEAGVDVQHSSEGVPYVLLPLENGLHVTCDEHFIALIPKAVYARGPLKFHLSVDAGHVDAAWDAIVDYLSEHQLWAKVMTPEFSAETGDPTHRQAGKSITLYAEPFYEGPPIPLDETQPLSTPATISALWTEHLAALEDLLKVAGIPPGLPVRGDCVVGRFSSSGYWYARYDRTVENDLLRSTAMESHQAEHPYFLAGRDGRQLPDLLLQSQASIAYLDTHGNRKIFSPPPSL